MTITEAFKSTASALAVTMALGSVVVAGSAMMVTEAAAAVVSRIVVQGNRRVDDDTVRGFLTIRPGQNFGSGDIDASIRQLFNTGLFADVRIRQEGGTLVVDVIEQAIVNQVLFIGNEKVKDSQLTAVTRTNARGAFDPTEIASDENAIRDAYDRIGRSVNVTSEVETIEDGRVNVTFRIDEGDRTGIAAIDFVGNEAFGDRRLRQVLTTKRSNFLSFLNRRDVFDEDRIAADEERLRRFYFNRGYADFQVVSSVADLDPATNEYTITITVDEGARYTFGEVTVDSTVPGLEGDELLGRVKTRSGNVYSAEDIEDSLIAISENVANRGFAFADVTPRGSRNFANNTIDVAYVVDEGPRAFIERIEIRGNTRTRDFVIRREFDLSEGDPFNRILVRRAKRRLEDLGFFEKVDVRTVQGSEPDRIILVVQVEDKSTGEFGIGAGYQTAGEGVGSGKPQFDLSIRERNLLGRGQTVSAGIKGTTEDRTISFSFTEPYFLGRRLAAGFDLERSSELRTNVFDPDNNPATDNDEPFDFEEITRRATLRMTAPLTNELSLTGFYTYKDQRYEFEHFDPSQPLSATNVCPTVVTVCADARNLETYVSSSLGYALTYDGLDNRADPRSGFYAQFRQEFAGVGGDANWLKTTASARYYRTLSEDLDVIGLVKASGGNITELGSDSLRAFDMFRNGPSIVRGFKSGGIGPYDAAGGGARATGDSLGGTNYVSGGVEASFPVPIFPRDFGLRGAVFADAGTVWNYGGATTVTAVDGTTRNIVVADNDFDLRASVGVSLLWASPFGPLRLDYAEPIVKKDGDVIQKFNFGISGRF